MSYVITYPGGAYGNFVGFTLRWLMGEYPVDFRPFTSKGNSHSWNAQIVKFDKVSLENLEPMLGIDTFAILHPKGQKDHNLIERLELLTKCYDKVIYICPRFEDCIWLLNNRQTKIYPEGWIEHFKNKNEFANLDSWESSTKEIWEEREFLSIYLYDQLLSETELANIIDYKNYDSNKIKIIYMNDLRDNFSLTFRYLCSWLNLEVVRSQLEIDNLEKDWKNNEKFLFKDRLIEDLVNATIDNKNFPMENLTYVDEAMMQWKLRNKGFELKCYNLNKWPETTSELRDLIYEN